MPFAAIKPGALVDGPELIVADIGFQIDNMEGLSVHREPSGALVLTIISDDNFSPLQRTVLLQFALERGIETPPCEPAFNRRSGCACVGGAQLALACFLAICFFRSRIFGASTSSLAPSR